MPIIHCTYVHRSPATQIDCNRKRKKSHLFYTENNRTCENEFGFISGNAPKQISGITKKTLKKPQKEEGTF